MLDLKEIFNSGAQSFEVHGFKFEESDTNLAGEPGKLFFTLVGANDSMSRGYAIELNTDGEIRVYQLSDSTKVDHNMTPWSYERLVELIRKYESLTHDVRD